MSAPPVGVLFYEARAKPLSTTGLVQPGAYYQFYSTGTLSFANVYADGLLAAPLSQTPGIGGTTAASDGRLVPIYLNPATTYRYQLYSATNILLEDVDPYIPAPIPTLTQFGSVLYPILPSETGVTNVSYPYGDVRRFGADSAGSIDSSTAINNAQASGGLVYFSNGTYRVSSNTTLNRGVTFNFLGGGLISVDTTKTVSIGGQIVAGNTQIFTGAGNVITLGDYTNGPGVYNVKWWGAKGDNIADDTNAIQAACNATTSGLSQGTLYFPLGQYRILNTTSGGRGIVVGGSINLQGEGQHTILYGIGFTSSNPIISRGSVTNPQLNFYMRGFRFLSDNSGAAAMSISYCSDCEFTDIYLDTLATGIVCGINVFSNLWTVRHLGGVIGRNFIVNAGGFNNNIFIGGRFGGAGFVMQHTSGGCAGNVMYGVDFEGTLAAGTGGCYIAPTGSGVVRGLSLIGCYAENANSPLIYASGSINTIYGLSVTDCYLNGQNAGATYAITVQNVNGVSIRGNDFDAWATGIINNLGGNSNWDVGPNDYTNTPVWSSDSATQVLSNGSTIQTSVAVQNNQITVSSASAVTGIIMVIGIYDGQTIAVSNVNGSNSVTMATAATSHVATGTSCVIAAGTQKLFTWRSTGLGTPIWFSN